MQLEHEEDRRKRTTADVVLRNPFVRQFPFADGWSDDQYTELMAEWNIYAPHEVPDVRMDPAEASVIALQRELIRNVGDSVCTGLLTMATDGTAVKSSPINILGVPPPPSFQLATSPATSLGAAFTLNGKAYALPLTLEAVAEIATIARSMRTAEAVAANLQVSDAQKKPACCQGDATPANPMAMLLPQRLLKDVNLSLPAVSSSPGGPAAESQAGTAAVEGDFVDVAQSFPGVADAVLRALCPDAESVRFVPHRVDVYERGDSLAYTTLQDNMPDEGEDFVGAFCVNMPTMSDYEQALTRMSHKNMDVRFDPDRTVGTFETGEHRFYSGRALASQNEEIPLDIIHNMKDVGFDRPSAAAVLETRVALAEYTAVEVTNAAGVRPLKFVAWGPDVVFESLPVLASPMVTLRYKVYRSAACRKVWNVPRREVVLHLLHTAFSFMALRPNPVSTLPTLQHDPAFLRPVHIGIILRHAYEPNAVLDAVENPPAVLRGLDAVTYRIASSAFETRLLPAVVYKSDCHCAAWRVQEFPHRFVFASMKGYPELRSEAGLELSDTECMPLLVSALENTIVNCLWAQIGNGRLMGGGGNAFDECVCDTIPDCGTDWWYQNAVLVVTPEPARWARRRAVFAVRDRSLDQGPSHLAGALSHWNILETIATFL